MVGTKKIKFCCSKLKIIIHYYYKLQVNWTLDMKTNYIGYISMFMKGSGLKTKLT